MELPGAGPIEFFEIVGDARLDRGEFIVFNHAGPGLSIVLIRDLEDADASSIGSLKRRAG